jgi:hypothetical protein
MSRFWRYDPLKILAIAFRTKALRPAEVALLPWGTSMSTCDKPDSGKRTEATSDNRDKLRNHIRRMLSCIKVRPAQK